MWQGLGSGVGCDAAVSCLSVLKHRRNWITKQASSLGGEEGAGKSSLFPQTRNLFHECASEVEGH